MVAKMSVKNQITIPKKILERIGLLRLKDKEMYFDIETKDNLILLKPVALIVEEIIPPQQWRKFEDWATKTEKGDFAFDSARKATAFLRKK